MSSQLHKPIHFNSVEKAIAHLYWKNDFTLPDFDAWHHVYPDLYKKLVSKEKFDKSVAQIMDTIRTLSVIAIYREHKQLGVDVSKYNTIQMVDYLIHNKEQYIKLDDMELLKALESVLYQIDDEYFPRAAWAAEERIAYQFLEALTRNLMSYIIGKLPAWSNANTFAIGDQPIEDRIKETKQIDSMEFTYDGNDNNTYYIHLKQRGSKRIFCEVFAAEDITRHMVDTFNKSDDLKENINRF